MDWHSDIPFVTRFGVVVVVLIGFLTAITVVFATDNGVELLACVDTKMMAAATDPFFIEPGVWLEDARSC